MAVCILSENGCGLPEKSTMIMDKTSTVKYGENAKY